MSRASLLTNDLEDLVVAGILDIALTRSCVMDEKRASDSKMIINFNHEDCDSRAHPHRPVCRNASITTGRSGNVMGGPLVRSGCGRCVPPCVTETFNLRVFNR